MKQEIKQLKKEKELTTQLGQNPFLQGLQDLLRISEEESIELAETLSGANPDQQSQQETDSLVSPYRQQQKLQIELKKELELIRQKVRK